MMHVDHRRRLWGLVHARGYGAHRYSANSKSNAIAVIHPVFTFGDRTHIGLAQN